MSDTRPYADAAFDFNGLRFLFPTGRVEPITINEHLRAAIAI